MGRRPMGEIVPAYVNEVAEVVVVNVLKPGSLKRNRTICCVELALLPDVAVEVANHHRKSFLVRLGGPNDGSEHPMSLLRAQIRIEVQVIDYQDSFGESAIN